jgi:hypothetical protein
MTDWQPIESAPKDGTWILVSGFRLGKEKTVSHRYAVVAYYLLTERRPELGGYWFFGSKDNQIVKDPIYWMLLPEEPRRQEPINE